MRHRSKAGTAAWWRFESGAAPAVDSSANGGTGAITGATYDSLVPWLGPPSKPGLSHTLRHRPHPTWFVAFCSGPPVGALRNRKNAPPSHAAWFNEFYAQRG